MIIDLNELMVKYVDYYVVIVGIISFLGIWIWNEVMIDHLDSFSIFHHNYTVSGRFTCFMVHIMFSCLCVLGGFLIIPCAVIALIYFILKFFVDKIVKLIKLHINLEYQDKIRPGD